MDTAFKQALARCWDRQALSQLADEQLKAEFRSTRTRLFYFQELPLDNPVTRFLADRECPVHEAQLVDNATWRAHCPRADHGHVLVGPLLAGTRMVGALAVTRSQQQGLFQAEDLQRMTRLSLQFSCRLSELERGTAALPQLTPRQNEVARLVAQGLANAEIGRQLKVSEQTVKQFLKSIYAKLGVRSRAQLTALVCSGR
jgi:DNA-binding CsgD family transcriptional regulator